MKKARAGAQDGDMRPEYDFSAMRSGVRGKYFRRFQSGTNVVLLEPEVAKAFPTDAAVNAALRAVLRATSVVKRSSVVPKRRPKRRIARPR